MIFELIAVFAAGFAGAGVLLLLTRLVPRLPRWLVPIGAGAAMFAVAISGEYGWYERTRGALPEDMVVADAVSERMWWRPWTYVAPMVTRFVAFDRGNLRENRDAEALYMADLYFFGRWRPVQSVQVMVDCVEGRRADPGGGDGGAPVWRDVGPEDPIVRTVCRAA
ncbi:hypothetical protein SAMN04490244_104159 [Tranquillimonas rosea]|uniref:Uncharacterized protein n=1 Tax=Tranquillimonas rosea TaxID=641238 RepID=A0A1H9TG26_9RHOB|nr:hypothetical protein [Tranquillimonas rosea]SER96056.1 hypothetical protein SAMN04490244_104159 [Tranquillimonas rosea]